MSMRAVRLVSGVLVVGLLLPSLGCKRKPGTGDTVTASTPLPPIDLKPLPDAMTIQVNPEDLPGADGSLAVVAARPQGKTYGNFRPTITFTKPVVALGTVEQTKDAAPPAKIDPAIAGEWKWLGSSSLEFVPKGLVPYSTKFTVTVPAGLKAVDGAALQADYVFAFTTPEPELQSSEPVDGFRWLGPNQKMNLVFNQPVADLSSKLLLSVNGASWPVSMQKEVNV